MDKNKYQRQELPSDTLINLNQSRQENMVISQNKNSLVQNQNNVQGNNLQEHKNPSKQRKLYVDLREDIPVMQPEKYCNNEVTTSQYTIFTFLPLALFRQYKNPFNAFFLVMMIINLIPAIAPVKPVTTIVPVLVVLAINLIKEAVEDYKKHKNDKRVNDSINYVYKYPKFVKERSKMINVGNIVKIKKEETLPADLLIIKSSLENGFCYMQTANLDGETALKPRESIYLTHQKLKYKSPKSFKNMLSPHNENCFIEVDAPNANIYEINGTIIIKGQKIYFDSKNIMLKGSRLKSVDYIFGIAIYTGKETKLM